MHVNNELVRQKHKEELCGVSTMKRPDFIVFLGSKQKRYDPIITKYESYNTPSLI
jgi:hypothetical protein